MYVWTSSAPAAVKIAQLLHLDDAVAADIDAAEQGDEARHHVPARATAFGGATARQTTSTITGFTLRQYARWYIGDMHRAAVVVLGAGCFSPAPPEGAPCGDGLRPCPASQTCSPADNPCYADLPAGLDAPLATDGRVDAPPTTACTPRRLLAGGQPVEAQGWTREAPAPARSRTAPG